MLFWVAVDLDGCAALGCCYALAAAGSIAVPDWLLPDDWPCRQLLFSDVSLAVYSVACILCVYYEQQGRRASHDVHGEAG